MASFRTGHIVLKGETIRVIVRDAQDGTTVSRRTGQWDGVHLEDVERALGSIKDAKKRLRIDEAIPIEGSAA